MDPAPEPTKQTRREQLKWAGTYVALAIAAAFELTGVAIGGHDGRVFLYGGVAVATVVAISRGLWWLID